MDKSNELNDNLLEWGASQVGFAYVADYIEGRYRDLPFAISIAVRLSDRVIDEIHDMPTYTYFHHYRTVNSFIDQLTLRAGLFIQNLGYQYIAVPASQTVKDAKEPYSAIFPHKTAATLSGLGWVGKNGLLISSEFGPRIRLGTILTDMPIPYSNNKIIDRCGDCTLCTSSCPAMAIRGNKFDSHKGRENIVDAHACSQYMKNKFQHIGRGSVCGICVQVCPHGKRRKK